MFTSKKLFRAKSLFGPTSTNGDFFVETSDIDFENLYSKFYGQRMETLCLSLNSRVAEKYMKSEASEEPFNKCVGSKEVKTQ